MSGATVAYNLRKNKHVERHLFIDLLRIFERWKSVRNHLYIGFGGIYFEDYKLLHTTLGIDKMVSLEQEPWMLARQNKNVPFGCVEPRRQTSGEFILEVDDHRSAYSVDNVLVWLDYATPKDLVIQLTEVRSLLPKLVAGDIVKITLSLHTKWLDGRGYYPKRFERRLEKIKTELGSSFLPDGVTIEAVLDDALPAFYLATLKRAISEGMSESPHLEFAPMGCYTYSDGTQMLTVTGAVVSKAELELFVDGSRLVDFDLGSPNWELITIKLPDLSLRERLILDQAIYTAQPGMPAATCEAAEVADKLGFQLAAEADESLSMVDSYIKLYRYYPSFHRVQL
jgi:hypothetical protein